MENDMQTRSGAAQRPGSSENGKILPDAYGRKIDYIRISLTDRCNFRCIYCMPHDGMPYIPHDHILRYEELLRLCANFAALGISRYKITGGEPLCRKGAPEFISALSTLPGVEEVTLTTNGSLLPPHLEMLARNGLDSVTFSCDAVNPQAFSKITRSEASPGDIFNCMQTAAALGLRVKLNMVPIKGCNDNELIPLARFALERGFHIRFIELMPVGEAMEHAGIPQDMVHALMEEHFGPLQPVAHKTGNGPAEVFSVPGHSGYIGFIAALSHRFCDSCNRVRLTSTGFLKTCLCHGDGIDLRPPFRAGASDESLQALIREAVFAKPKGHTFSFSTAPGSGFFMNSVGG